MKKFIFLLLKEFEPKMKCETIKSLISLIFP